MKLAEQYGTVFSLSESAYKKLLTQIANGQNYDLGALGKCLGVIAITPLDMDESEASEKLALL